MFNWNISFNCIPRQWINTLCFLIILVIGQKDPWKGLQIYGDGDTVMSTAKVEFEKFTAIHFGYSSIDESMAESDLSPRFWRSPKQWILTAICPEPNQQMQRGSFSQNKFYNLNLGCYEFILRSLTLVFRLKNCSKMLIFS